MKTEEVIFGIDFIRAHKLEINGDSNVLIKDHNCHKINCVVNNQTVIVKQIVNVTVKQISLFK